MNDTTQYREAAIRHLPELLTALAHHVHQCAGIDCGLCAVWERIVSSRTEQAEREAASQETYRRQVEHEQSEERKDAL